MTSIRKSHEKPQAPRPCEWCSVIFRPMKKRGRFCGRSCATKAQNTRHGHAIPGMETRTHKTWASVLARCRNPNASGYARYGGRGITVCERWLAYDRFLADMGERPVGKTLDRIDGDGPYAPSNCRWATPKEQSANRAITVFVEHGGERLCLRDWAKRAGLNDATLGSRLRSGWSFERAVTTPTMSGDEMKILRSAIWKRRHAERQAPYAAAVVAACASGMAQRAVAQMYGISQAAVSNLVISARRAHAPA